MDATLTSRPALAAILVLACAAGFVRHSPGAAGAPPAFADRASQVARGDYLTHHVAMCVECHSPRDANGDIIRAEEFHGGPVLIPPPYWKPNWALEEPSIAGLPGMTDEDVIALLTTGRIPNRTPPRRPMPPFRLSREDAEAVVAYLRTR